VPSIAVVALNVAGARDRQVYAPGSVSRLRAEARMIAEIHVTSFSVVTRTYNAPRLALTRLHKGVAYEVEEIDGAAVPKMQDALGPMRS
jgi:hypothetical protein